MAYLLDTNHLSAVIRPVSVLRDKVLQRHRAGERFAICWPVLCELEFGILDTPKPDRYYRSLNHVLEIIRIWSFDWHVIRLYGTTAMTLRRQGRALSQVDTMLAAFARHYAATILTTDNDFKALSEIRTENWLAP
jgi:tRNA(fMet)-specific endonuclease VapC